MERICLLSDRNQPSLIAVVSPSRDFVLKVAADLGILNFCDTRIGGCGVLPVSLEPGRMHVEHQAQVKEKDSFFKFLCRHEAINAAVFASIIATAHIYSNNHSFASSSSTGIALTLFLSCQLMLIAHTLFIAIFDMIPNYSRSSNCCDYAFQS